MASYKVRIVPPETVLASIRESLEMRASEVQTLRDSYLMDISPYSDEVCAILEKVERLLGNEWIVFSHYEHTPNNIPDELRGTFYMILPGISQDLRKAEELLKRTEMSLRRSPEEFQILRC